MRLDHLLWVRGEAESAVSRAIKALNLVVSAGGFGLVVFDAGGVPARALRQLPFTTWLRVQRVLEGSDTACVLLADAPLARSTGGASVRLGARGSPRSPTARPCRTFTRRCEPTGSSAPVRTRAGSRACRHSADVQYALRSASCVLTATEPRRDLATETQSAQRFLGSHRAFTYRRSGITWRNQQTWSLDTPGLLCGSAACIN